MTYDVTRRHYWKQWQNSDLRETIQIISYSKGNDESFPKMYLLLKLSHLIKSYGHLSKIFAYF